MARLFDDGSSQYLRIDSAVLVAEPLTMAYWFNTNAGALGNAQRMIGISHGAAIGGRSKWAIHIRANAAGIIAQKTDSVAVSGNAISTGSVSTNTWMHAAGVFTNDTSRAVYLNGSEDTNATDISTDFTADTTAIGAYYTADAGEDFLSGMEAEVGIWNVALTQAEINVLKTGFSPLAVRPQSLVSYWPVIGRTSPEIDIVGGYDMTLINGPTVADHPPMMYLVSPMIVYVPTADVSVVGPFPTFL